MGKNKASKFTFLNPSTNLTINVDSQEEVDFFYWLFEAKELGIIEDFEYQPKPFLLSDSIKYKNINGKIKTMFREHIYTPDFKIKYRFADFPKLAEEFKYQIPEGLLTGESTQYIDVKGTFAKNDGGRSFSINQKWVYDKYKVYIYKLIPKEFFKKFGVPEKCKLTEKTKKPRKMFSGYKSIKEWLLNQ